MLVPFFSLKCAFSENLYGNLNIKYRWYYFAFVHYKLQSKMYRVLLVKKTKLFYIRVSRKLNQHITLLPQIIHRIPLMCSKERPHQTQVPQTANLRPKDGHHAAQGEYKKHIF